MSITADLEARVRAFIDEDPDAAGRAALDAQLEAALAGDAEAQAALEDAFFAPLTFGTAGLRGRIGPGIRRMNRVVVAKATWGVGQYLRSTDAQAAADGVVIAFDARRMSRQFAEDAASILTGMGIRVHIFDTVVPTPLCAYAVRALGAAAGIMVTASHNPPDDNGYKVYWRTGGQIIPPHDTGIAAHIADAPRFDAMTTLTPFAAATAGLRCEVSDDVERDYLAAIRGQAWHTNTAYNAQLSVVYTAMHGVGHRLVSRALRGAGFAGVLSVPAQTEPDGAFPSVAFPNPEEPGAMDLSIEAAEASGADLAIANDPDADRLAVLVRHAGAYRMLSGNELGTLLGADALAHAPAPDGQQKLAVTTIVSSTMLSRVAKAHGAAYGETLTGFKWIADLADARAQDGQAFVFGYEQALGYLVGDLVRDKDGVSAALRLCELAAALKAEGKTLVDQLDALCVAHGLSEAHDWSVRFEGAAAAADMAAQMQAWRDAPPATLGGEAVVRRIDLQAGTETAADGTVTPAALPTSNVLVFWTAAGTRLILRPSGTEPKLKVYLEATGDVADAAALPGVRDALKTRLASIAAEVEAKLG